MFGCWLIILIAYDIFLDTLRFWRVDRKIDFYFTTASLLLHEHGIEVVMRPCLYPREAFGNSDATDRLLRLSRMIDFLFFCVSDHLGV